MTTTGNGDTEPVVLGSRATAETTPYAWSVTLRHPARQPGLNASTGLISGTIGVSAVGRPSP